MVAIASSSFSPKMKVLGTGLAVELPFLTISRSLEWMITAWAALPLMSFRRHRTNMHNLLSQDGRTDDWFGWSIAVSDDIVVTGEAYKDDNNGEDTGFAYVFSAFGGRQLHKLLPKVLCQGDN